MRRFRRLSPTTLEAWGDARRVRGGSVALLSLPVTEGFVLADGPAGSPLSVLAAHAALPRVAVRRSGDFPAEALRIGDLVVEPTHGLARLGGLQLLEDPAGTRECLVLEFAADQRLLIRAEEAGKVWRYGSAQAEASPDRLTGETWRRRCAEVEAEITEVAAALAERRRLRDGAKAPAVTPPRGALERFTRRVPFALTEDQSTAVKAVLSDIARTRPMERLICGDVGFGKTEVALHAAAATALSGQQVAVAAPTTLLAAQHLATFRRRLGPLGINVAPLMHSVRSAQSRETLAGLRSGEVAVAVGTHALASDHVEFAQLALVVIDEEQRFGEKHKRSLHALRSGVHALTMTATPLPRSLQAAMAGLFDLSLLATPPVARQPVRTAVLPFDGAMVRAALLREARRGGQSFVVCPRIEDLAPIARRLGELVPELTVAQAHGKLRADALDEVMLDFADGRTDVLLATGIIEAGLDIPNANTMLVWRPDRFGLAELHQLRGRVGRGRARASAYLLTDPAHPLAPSAVKRLEQITALDQLGAGFAISGADLDQRGAGDLLGERQAGHLRLMGSELYGHLLERAVAAAAGKTLAADWEPEIALDAAAFIPEAMVPEPDVRLELYRRLARLGTAEAVNAFAEEVEDRFGELHSQVGTLFDLARLRLACRALGIAALNAGPEAIALSPHEDADIAALTDRFGETIGMWWSRDRLILEIAEPQPEARLQRMLALLG
jgi:transcription-repair coupling factor (superfamily II helicase)